MFARLPRSLAPAATILTALILVVGLAGPAAAIISKTYETQIHVATNKERTSRDLVKVKGWSCVERFAERHARWMAKHQQMKHQKLGPILEACELTGVSENIAYGYASGKKTVAAWMKSTGHKRNILAPKMRYTGVGAVKDENGRWWVAQVFGTRK